MAYELIDRTDDLDALSDEKFELTFANSDHVKSELPQVSSMQRKAQRRAAKGEIAKCDIEENIKPDKALKKKCQ